MTYYSNQFPIREKEPKAKPTTGKLWYNGQLILSDRPFPLLQLEKKKLLATGNYRKNLFKITY